MIIEVTVALRASPSKMKNFDSRSNRPDSQDTREIDTSFISFKKDLSTDYTELISLSV